MLDPLVVGTDEDTHQVTAIISHFIRPGREQGYEEWLHGIATAAHQFKGHLGVSVIRPCDRSVMDTFNFDFCLDSTLK